MDPNQPDSPPPPRVQVPPPITSLNVPLIYADAMLDARFGAFTSRILLGVEQGQFNVPALQVVMPTGALLEAARRIVEVLSSDETIKETKEHQSAMVQLMEVGTKR
jgi:hypothetical protein